MKTILIVDDDLMIAELYRAFLKIERKNLWRVHDEIDVHDAVDYAKNSPPDVIFLDNRIPPFQDFREPLKLLVANGYAGPVVVQSASIEQDVLSEARDLGASLVLDKWNVSSTVFVDLISSLTGERAEIGFNKLA